MRRIVYVTGTRADFGLMLRTLQLAQASGEIDVALCVTGMHLSPTYGNTVREVEASGLRIAARVPVRLDDRVELLLGFGHAITPSLVHPW